MKLDNQAAVTIGLPSTGILLHLQAELRACMQCGTCTGSCGSAGAMDLVPREVWRMLQLGLENEVFRSRSFWLCSSCYRCTLRCPRGLELTKAMSELKHLAIAGGILPDRKSPLFYESFMNVVQLYGRVRETELMGKYFLSLRSPTAPFRFLPLGFKLMKKGKISIRFPQLFGQGKLDSIFRKTREIEDQAAERPV